MKQEDEHPRTSPKISGPTDVFVKASEVLVEGYERRSKQNEQEVPRNRRVVKRKEAGLPFSNSSSSGF